MSQERRINPQLYPAVFYWALHLYMNQTTDFRRPKIGKQLLVLGKFASVRRVQNLLRDSMYPEFND